MSEAERIDAETDKPAGFDFLGPDMAALKTTAGMTGVDYYTLRRWAEKYGIGRKIGGRWYISRSKLQAFIAGRNTQP